MKIFWKMFFELKLYPYTLPFGVQVCLECELWSTHTDYGLLTTAYGLLSTAYTPNTKDGESTKWETTYNINYFCSNSGADHYCYVRLILVDLPPSCAGWKQFLWGEACLHDEPPTTDTILLCKELHTWGTELVYGHHNIRAGVLCKGVVTKELKFNKDLFYTASTKFTTCDNHSTTWVTCVHIQLL